MLHALQYKTRGGSLPGGKRKVYFCALAEDTERFIDAVCEDVLKLQNCAVWYDPGSGEETDEETRESDIQTMNLFLVPVTERLLRSPDSRAVKEIRLALEKHIPVLPLMQESGLDERFSQLFGDIQYLDKNASDGTAIGYEEKLEKYLSSVLIGDEQAKRIRDAFDAYIFLSYRKKDRRYAQQLMRLIHKNEFCRDIAIWYDEFLTPGENFNDEIAAALDKSRLFALAVTPNLVKEQNYVMQVEYPMAKKAGKPILPAVMVATSERALKKNYEDIPDPVDASDSQALSAALIADLEELAVKENDNSPEHNFFIGLAYLSGIDVEIDYDKALSLITGAAEAGLAEAAEKLVSMYKKADGVDRSYEKSAEWQEKLVAIRKSEVCANGKGTVIYLDALLELGSAYRELDMTEKALATYDLVEEEALRLYRDPENESCKIYCLNAYKFNTLVYSAENRMNEAILSAKKAISLCDESDGADKGSLARAAETHSALADALRAVGRITEAMTEYEVAQALKLRCFEGDEGSLSARRSIAISYDDIGRIYSDLGKDEKAIEYCLKAYDLFEQVLKESPTVANRYSFYVCCDRLADAYKSSDTGKALEYMFKAYELLTENYSETESPSAYESLINLYTSIARIYDRTGRDSRARYYYDRAVIGIEEKPECFVTAKGRHNMAGIYSRYGNFLRKLKEYEGAEKYLLRSLEIRKGFQTEGGMSTVILGVGQINENLGLLYQEIDMPEKAREYYANARDVFTAVSDSGDRDGTFSLVNTLVRLGELEKKQGRMIAAISCFEKARAHSKELCSDGAEDAIRTYAYANEMYANALFESNRQRSVSLYAEAKELYYNLWKSTGGVIQCKDAYRLSSWLASDYGSGEKALKEYACACELASAADVDTVKHARLLTDYAKLCIENGMPDEAEKNVLSAISMSEGSALLLAKTVCGEIFLKSGRFDEAENCLANVCLEYSLVCLKSRSAEDYFGFAAALDLLGDANTGKRRKKYYKRSLKLLKSLIKTFPQDKYQHLYDTVQNKINSI